MLNNQRLSVSSVPPYDPLQAFVRDNHIALSGAKEGPLADLVFGAKDVFKILGSTWGNGHPEWLENSLPDEFTSSSIVKLLDSGADLVGKTVCDELCYSISGENWNYGHPINPQDARRLTGGSSSGSCAATAGGLVDFAIGSDCLGSVRVPASYNGVIGLRPTYQRIENDGEAPYCKSMDVLGYVANTPDTFKKVSKVLLGEDKKEFKFKRVLVAKDAFEAINQGVSDALQVAIDFIGDQVETVDTVTVAPEGLDKWLDVFKIVQGYEVWESYGGFVNKYRPRLSPGPKERLEAASKITREEYNTAYEEMKKIKEHMTNLLDDETLIVLPTASSVAPLKTTSIEEIDTYRQQSSKLLCISPLSGVPQVTIPLVEQDDVPLGISLLSAHDTDLALTNFAADLLENFKK